MNNYVAVHYGGRQMNFLHSFWGVGATAGPLILAAYIDGGNWRGGYRAVGLIQLVIACILFFALPLWGKVAAREGVEPVEQTETSYTALLKKPGVMAALLTFILYCGGEMTAGLWSGTYLVTALGFAPERAARWTSTFFFGMMAGRLLSGLLSGRVPACVRMRAGRYLALLGAGLLLLPSAPDALRFFALPAIGLGCAPVFPCMIQLTPERYGPGCSQALIGMEMAASYIGSSALPPLFGLLANAAGFRLFPFVLILYFIGMGFFMRRLERLFSFLSGGKKRNKRKAGAG